MAASASAVPLTRASYSSREIAFSAIRALAWSATLWASSAWVCARVSSACGAIEGVLVLALVDDEEHVTLPHFLPLGERHLLDEAGDAGPHLDVAHRLDAAGELIPFIHGAPDGGGGGDGWRWRRRRRRRAARCQQERDCCRAGRALVEALHEKPQLEGLGGGANGRTARSTTSMIVRRSWSRLTGALS